LQQVHGIGGQLRLIVLHLRLQPDILQPDDLFFIFFYLKLVQVLQVPLFFVEFFALFF